MAFMLKRIVPWGRSFDEYRRMFALTNADLQKRILGCADGPASFNANLTATGGFVVSTDPLYQCSADQIRQRIEATLPEMVEQTKRNMTEFVWSDDLPSVDALVRYRLESMEQFLEDYEIGRTAGRYVVAELPAVPFAADSFDLALCSHFLFLYSEQLSTHFHLNSIRSLIEVAEEVRLFPLLELGALPSRHVDPLIRTLREEGCQAEIETVDYEFQRGGNKMLRIRR